MNNHWPSTKALSVYNALRANKTNSLPSTAILAFLQANHLPVYDANDVLEGIEFLQAKGFARLADDTLRATHCAGPGSPIPLKRSADDSDLLLNP